MGFIPFMNCWNVLCQARFSSKFHLTNVALHIGFDFFMHSWDMSDQCILWIKGVFTNFALNRCFFFFDFFAFVTERLSSHSKEVGLVIYLAFLAKMANLYYMILTAFKKYWPNTVVKFISGTQETFI